MHTLKPVGAQFKRVVEIALPLELIHEAQGWAIEEKRAALALSQPARAELADRVLQACGRLLMLSFGGRNRNYDPAPDRALIRAARALEKMRS